MKTYTHEFPLKRHVMCGQ